MTPKEFEKKVNEAIDAEFAKAGPEVGNVAEHIMVGMGITGLKPQDPYLVEGLELVVTSVKKHLEFRAQLDPTPQGMEEVPTQVKDAGDEVSHQTLDLGDLLDGDDEGGFDA